MRIFDTTIDVKKRQFFILALAACIGNLAGFIGNMLIYGFGMPTIFCGFCSVCVIICSLLGIFKGYVTQASYFIIVLLSLLEFPMLYYMYQSGTIVYMILSIIGIATFLSGSSAFIIMGLTVICDIGIIIITYCFPPDMSQVTRQNMFTSTLCSLIIVMFSTFLITTLTNIQQRKQAEQLIALNEQMKKAADHDALTGIYNRRYLNKYLEKLIETEACEFYAVIIDLDYFKKLNDSYGHLFGDEVLVEFCNIVTKHIKDKGIVSRFGGEEFMLIFPHSNNDEIKALLTSMRKDYKAFIKSRKNVEFSFSSGVTKYEEGMTISTLYNLADKKLYYAKENNRDMDVFNLV